MRSSDDLKAEYLLIQSQYEAFDQRALSLKALATPLLGAGIAFGSSQADRAVIVATIAVAAALWLLEAIWKAFQYCFTGRIVRIEAWFRGEGEEELPPFQIFAAWGAMWRERYRHPRHWLPILWQPFVCLPYVVVILAGVALCLI